MPLKGGVIPSAKGWEAVRRHVNAGNSTSKGHAPVPRRYPKLSGGGAGDVTVVAGGAKCVRILQVYDDHDTLGPHCLCQLLTPVYPVTPDFEIAYVDSNTPAAGPATLPANRNGTVAVLAGPNAISETWTLTLVSGPSWQLEGSVSGLYGEFDFSSGSVVIDNTDVVFIDITNGSQPFQVGDVITFTVTAGEVVAFPDPVVLYAIQWLGVNLSEAFTTGDARYWMFTVSGVNVLMPGGLTADVDMMQSFAFDQTPQGCSLVGSGVTLRIVGGFILSAL